MERKEVETIAELAVARHHAENVMRLTKIEERIIGIDGNGTGRKGALQRQDDKLEELSESQKRMSIKLDTLLVSSRTWDKKAVTRTIRWMFATIIALLGLLFTWMQFRAHYHENVAAGHAQVESFDAQMK